MWLAELLGVITVAFEFNRFAEYRLKLFGSLTVKPLSCLFYSLLE